MSDKKQSPEKIDLKLEQIEPEKEIVVQGHEINSNKLGSFGSTDFASKPRDFYDEPKKQNLGTAKPQAPKIDFEKFTRTKTTNQPTSSFGLKIEHLLRTPKSLKQIWIWASVMLSLVFVVTIASIVLVNKEMSSTASGPHNFPYIKGLSQAVIVLSYLGLILPLLPIMFLITSWFVGINGIHTSRIFHYVLWSFLLFAVACTVLELVFTIDILANCWSFNPIPPEPPSL